MKKTKQKKLPEFLPDDDELDIADGEQQPSSKKEAVVQSKIGSFFETQFSYLPIFTGLDDVAVIKLIAEKYGVLGDDSIDEKTARRELLSLFSNKKFMDEILDYFSLNIEEFLCIIFRNYAEAFSSVAFLKKLQKAILENNYPRK